MFLRLSSVLIFKLYIIDLFEKALQVSMCKDVLLEKLFMKLFENHIAFEFMMKNRLHEKDPHLFNSYYCISDSCVKLNKQVKYFLIGVWLFVEWYNDFIILAHFTPYAMSQIIPDSFILWIDHVLHTMIQDVVITAMKWITPWEIFVNE